MAQEYDVVLKLLFRRSGDRIVRELMGSAVTKWLDKELPQVRNTRADMLGETAEGELVQWEFQSDLPKFTGLRMAGYYVEIYRLFDRHPVQILIYVGRAPCRLNPRFRSPTMDFKFRIVDLSKMDGDPFLKSESVGDRILAILMKLKDHAAAIRTILESIAELDANERADALRQLLVISGLRGLTSKIEEEVEKMPVLDDLMDNEVFAREYRKGVAAGMEKGIEKGREEGLERGIEKGIEQGEAKLLNRLIAHRFKRIPKWAQERLATANPDQLENWGQRLFDASTLRDVFDAK